MTRHLLNAITTFSLATSVALGGFWVHSYSTGIHDASVVCWTEKWNGYWIEDRLTAYSWDGSLAVYHEQLGSRPKWDAQRPLTATTPSPVPLRFRPVRHPRNDWDSVEVTSSGSEESTVWKTIGVIPYSALLCATVPVPLILIGLRCWCAAQMRRRASLCLCAKCGYDLRASTERCPECGAPILDTQVRKVDSVHAASRALPLSDPPRPFDI
jgi:hypothetical protein